MEWLLSIFGWHGDNVQRISDVGLGLGRPGALLWCLPLAVVLSVGVVWSYRRLAREFSGIRPTLLSTLRVVLLVLLLILFIRPVIGFNVETAIRRSLVLLIDSSASMKIVDNRASVDDQKRSALAQGQLDASKGLKQELPDGTSGLGVPRVRLVQQAMENKKIDLLRRLQNDFDVSVMTFGQKTAPVESNNPGAAPTWIGKLDAVAPVTALGDAVRDVIASTRGQQLGGIVVVSDGVINSGLPASAAAQLAKQDEVPLFLWGVGISNVRDIIVAELFAPETAFKEDTVPVTVRVRNRGLAGETASVQLKLNNDIIATKQITLDSAGEQVVVMQFAPTKPGEFTLSAGVEPREDEAIRDNNVSTQYLRVVDGKLKVLYVEQSPRWEFHYLRAQLTRDRRVAAKFVLVEADPAITGDNSPFLRTFPDSREELFKYNLIIIGDVAPSVLGSQGPALLEEYTTRFGGGVLMIAGRRSAPSAYFGTPLGKILPIEAGVGDRTGVRGGQVDDKPIQVELTPDGRQNAIMKLSDDAQETEKLWSSRPPIFWAYAASRAKPAAEVLMQFADTRTGGRGAKSPLVALHQVGAGTVAFVGTDNTWRWRAERGESIYTAFWGQLVQRLALPHFLGASPRTRLTSERRSYAVFEKVVLFARLYDQTFRPITEPTIDAVYQSAAGVRGDLTLRPVADQPGLYRGEFIAGEIGQYQFSVNRDPETRLDFAITEPKLEFAEAAMNEAGLRQMAATSGGLFVREEDLYRLPEQIKAKNEWVKSREEIEIALSPIYFVVLLALATVEWFIRKRVQLK